MMAVELKLNIQESMSPGEIDAYKLTFKVVNAVDIEPEIFIFERKRLTAIGTKAEEKFHHVAYFPEMSTISSTVNNDMHQYIRRSSVVRAYATLEQMQEGKRVIVDDIKELVRVANQLGVDIKETELTIGVSTEESEILNDEIYTFDGEIVNF